MFGQSPDIAPAQAVPAWRDDQTLKMSTSIKRHGRFWSEEDDNLLRAMAAAGKSLTLMTVKLGRPMRTIKARAQDLHIPLPGEDKTTKRWMG